MKNLTIRPINTGFVTTIPKQYLYHHSTLAYLKGIPDERIEMPVFTFLVEGGNSRLLVDTGMAWTERAEKYHHPGSHQPKGLSIVDQLKKIGYQSEDIDIVVFTHLHWDHIYYMEKFTKAVFIANETEYKFALDPIPLYYKSYEHPKLYENAEEKIIRPFEGISIKTVRGETEIMSGVRVFETPGHSPGHQSIEVDTKDGKYICCGDSIFVLDNINPIPEIVYDITPPGRYADIISTWKSIELQKKRVTRADFLLPCHEKALLERIKKTPVLGA
jgi:glyoxylase-like metal-dependent hydrolase (beta-lactamase superfamily II)